MLLADIQSKVKVLQGYYVGRTVTDSALIAVGANGMQAGLQIFMAGLAGELGSAVAEALSLGSGTAVVAVTTVISTVAVAVGAAVIVCSATLVVTATGSLAGDTSNLLMASSNESSSTKLKKNMRSAGMSEPSFTPNRAHHMVPGGWTKGELGLLCERARQILSRCGITDINSAVNGVYLPAKANLSGAGKASVDIGKHSGNYVRKVLQMLEDANPQNYNECVSVLNRIRQGLLDGSIGL